MFNVFVDVSNDMLFFFNSDLVGNIHEQLKIYKYDTKNQYVCFI